MKPDTSMNKGQRGLFIALNILAALACIYVFIVALELLGTSFKVLGGKGAGNLYNAVDNPVAGLMTGILGTVLVQSSSTSTSIVVVMVGAGQIAVKTAIPIIMGANIGTSVTNTIVSMGQAGDRNTLEKAFSGATVHDMFNFLNVLVLFPIEWIIGGIEGKGGPLYWISYNIAEEMVGGQKADELFESPTKTISKPAAEWILKANKYVFYALSLQKPEPRAPVAVNTSICEPLPPRRLSLGVEEVEAGDAKRLAVEEVSAAEGEEVEVEEEEDEIEQNAGDELDAEGEEGVRASGRSLLSRRMSSLEDCSTFYCVGKDLDKTFKKISSTSYKKLTKCKGIEDYGALKCAKKDKCYFDAGAFWKDKVEDGEIVKGGFLEGLGDAGAGILSLILALILLSGALVGLTTSLKNVLLQKAEQLLRHADKVNDYIALLIGIGVTIVVQSSSVTTSALTPLCGLGIIKLEKMFALTLGANIGTTMTAMVAALVKLNFNSVQIAFCHLFFNIFGIVIWFPIPFMRRIPLRAARLLGLYASEYRITPLIYILLAFVAFPGLCLGISAAVDASIAGGIVLLLFVVAILAVFLYAWNFGFPIDPFRVPLCYRLFSEEQRCQREKDMKAFDAELKRMADADGDTKPAEDQQPAQDPPVVDMAKEPVGEMSV